MAYKTNSRVSLWDFSEELPWANATQFQTMQQSHTLLQIGIVRLIRRVMITLITIVILMLIYHCYFCPPKINHKVGKVAPSTRQDFRMIETQDFLIDTPGCYIPNYAKTFKHNYLKKYTKTKNMCGVRHVFIDTIGDDKIKFRIYMKYNVRCCYRFAKEVRFPGHDHDLLSYTPCKIFTNNTIVWLEQEIITVTCTDLPVSPELSDETIIYKDTYIILKKIDESVSKSITNEKSMQWNVLMVGMDGMSRTRLFDTMPYTTKYLKKHKWLDFKAYHKVDDNTFQNLMSVLTGKRMRNISSNRTSDLEKCADFFIWKKR
ncbi:hypothetical protein PYW08_003708 [Mythimna loreyi]|uniref:Uncharacterized protein n=1 Tax=Mythimna loreyi TaxID=667449 RepID=A0ACC2QW07_9NEOP|nr:hypothetical protein PYW08_003708 [Mythimna loreyi]